ncbi:hypothetical protein AaE_013809 [Aphanomyces astaci]|uniref:Uncharacterized protein n=1 Tax=Aphanomyces astaci TaxID=112090 RepID=A0A6A4Z3S5_APHAT|nr:hypothetical protein AaE_013809 [Aphanomyces astaci]
MTHSSLLSPNALPLHPPLATTPPQAEKRKTMDVDHHHPQHLDLTHGITAKRVKIDNDLPLLPAPAAQSSTKPSGLWVQQSHAVVAKPKPATLRKSASVNDLWVKQTIAFVSRDV